MWSSITTAHGAGDMVFIEKKPCLSLGVFSVITVKRYCNAVRCWYVMVFAVVSGYTCRFVLM